MNPVSYLIEGVRSLIVIGWDGEALALGFGIAATVAVVAIALAASSLSGRLAPLVNRLAVAQGVAWRSLHNFTHNKSLLIPSLVFPLFFFTAFAGGLSGISHAPGLRLPGRLHRVPVRVRRRSSRPRSPASSPASGSPATSRAASPGGCCSRRRTAAGSCSATRAPRSGAGSSPSSVLTVVALAVRMKVGGSGVDLFGLYALGIMVNFAATLWAAGVAMRLRTMQAGPIMQMPVFLVLFFAPVYVPLALLQGWIHGVAIVNPMTRVLEAGRGFVAGAPTEVVAAFAAAAALGLLFSLWAFRGLRKAEAAG